MAVRFLFAGLCLLCAFPALATKLPYPGERDAMLPPRLALVIGVENYGDVGGEIALPSLPDATTDAVNLAKVLPDLGFSDVKLLVRTDERPLLDKQTIQAEIKDFKDRAKQAKQDTGRSPVLLFYFAGHGFSADGGSYLIPSNFFADDLYSFETNSISLLHDVVQKLELDFDPALQIIITDSCRTAKPINIPTISGQRVGSPGTADPNKGRIRPVASTPGKNRSVFFFSTLDGDPSYGESGVGGRFTTALVTALNEAVNAAKPPPSPPVTLDAIYYAASQDLEAEPSRKWQKPAYDPNWGAAFHLLPFEETFSLEKQNYEALALSSSDPKAALCAYSYSLRQMLKTFSEFSYFSQRIIEGLGSLPPCQRLPPLGGGLAAPPTKAGQKWNFPSLNPPSPSAPPPQTIEQPDIRGLLRHGSEWADKGAKLLEAFAQADAARPAVPLDEKPNFGEVRSALEQQGSSQDTKSLPPSTVTLDQAVVAKTDLFLRKAPGVQSAVSTSIAGGELLQVIGTSPGKTWLQVKHPKGSGYVSGDLVEPALLTFEKSIPFDDQQYELPEATKQDLVATFSLLGGVAIVDGYVEYSDPTSIVGLTRASLTAKYLSQLATQADASKQSRVYISVRPRSDASEPLKQNTVRLVLLGFPLDSQTRARLVKSGSNVALEAVSLGETKQPVPTSDPTCCGSGNELPSANQVQKVLQLKYCLDVGSAGESNCYVSNASPETGQLIEKAARDTGHSVDKAVHDTGKALEKAANDISKVNEKAAKDVGREIDKFTTIQIQKNLANPLGGPNSVVRKLFKF